jgi:hypothetical protein
LYHIESEAVGSVGGDIVRHQGNYSFTFNGNNSSPIQVPGNVDWAGVGDAYFAMAAIPAAQNQGLEYHASRYEVDTKPFYYSIFSWILRNATTKETRHLVTAHVPINADGSITKVYTGTKDYFTLEKYNEFISAGVGRPIDIIDLINFSNYSPIRWFVKPLSIPILSALISSIISRTITASPLLFSRFCFIRCCFRCAGRSRVRSKKLRQTRRK